MSSDDDQKRRDDYNKLRDLKKRASDLNFHSKEDEIVATLKELSSARVNNGHWHLEYDESFTNYVLQILHLKQQEKLLIEQNQYNRKQILWARVVAITAVLTFLVTLGILKFNPDTFARNFGPAAPTSTAK